MRGAAALAVLGVSACLAGTAAAADFCTDLRALVADAPNGFRAVKVKAIGTKTEFGETTTSYAARLSLAGFKECLVYDHKTSRDTTTDYGCSKLVAEKEAPREVERLRADSKSCFPEAQFSEQEYALGPADGKWKIMVTDIGDLILFKVWVPTKD